MLVDLDQQQWQAVLQHLGRSPYNEVAPLIAAIAAQLQKTLPRPNGEARETVDGQNPFARQ